METCCLIPVLCLVLLVVAAPRPLLAWTYTTSNDMDITVVTEGYFFISSINSEKVTAFADVAFTPGTDFRELSTRDLQHKQSGDETQPESKFDTAQDPHISTETGRWTSADGVSLDLSTKPGSSTVMVTTEATTQLEDKNPDLLLETNPSLLWRPRTVTEEHMLQNSPDPGLGLGDSTQMKGEGFPTTYPALPAGTRAVTEEHMLQDSPDPGLGLGSSTEMRTEGLPVTYPSVPERLRAVTEEQMLQDSPDPGLGLGDSTQMKGEGFPATYPALPEGTRAVTEEHMLQDSPDPGLGLGSSTQMKGFPVTYPALPEGTRAVTEEQMLQDSPDPGLGLGDSTQMKREGFPATYPALPEGTRAVTEEQMLQDSPDPGLGLGSSTEMRTEGLSVNTDRTYISSTISRAGERTLLSVTSNSTSIYSEDSNSSQPSTWGLPVSGTGAGEDHTDRFPSTQADGVDSMFGSRQPANSSSGGQPPDTEGPGLSPATVPLSEPPNTTQHDITSTSEDTANFTSSPGALDNNIGWEKDTRDHSHTTGGRTVHSEDEVSTSSVPPVLSTEDGSTNASQQGGTSSSSSTQSSTGPLSTQGQGGMEGGTERVTSQTAESEEITGFGLITVPPQGRDGVTPADDSRSRFSLSQPPFVDKTSSPGLSTEGQATTLRTTTLGSEVTEWEEETHRATAATTPTPPLATTWTVQPSSTTPLQVQTHHTTSPTTTTDTLRQQTSSSNLQHPGDSGTQTQTDAQNQTQTHTHKHTQTQDQTQTQTDTHTQDQTQTHTQTDTQTQDQTQNQTQAQTQMPSMGASPTDVTTLQLETSTATPGKTTAWRDHTTAANSKSTTTRSILAHATPTTRHTDGGTTKAEAATPRMDIRSTPMPGTACSPNSCVNGGTCVPHGGRGFTCQCLPEWTGPTCNDDVDECKKHPCPLVSTCENTIGSFSCECRPGFDLEDGRICTRAKTFLGTFSVINPDFDPQLSRSTLLHELQRELIQLLNASLSVHDGYRRSTLSKREEGGLRISAVNLFSVSTDVTGSQIHHSIQTSLNNCNFTSAHCRMILHHQLSYHAESLCQFQNCDIERSDCNDASGTAYCQCRAGYFKHNPEDVSCIECGDGYKLENTTCVQCTFGFGGFNCGNFYKLIAVVVSPAGGALLLILIIALIVTCCKKDKNDINKIIFKSGDFQMSPYTEFPKSNRVSMEWGRETIEMQENGSTKNLLQMTDIYYSPALRNSDLERNGLYPFSGLPGSRHSCIYPAQWNPSFISDDSRRRDYF